MAIVDKKRIRNLLFWKYRGRSEWCYTHYVPNVIGNRGVTFMASTPIEVDTEDDPRKVWWHYCSIMPQRAVFDTSELDGIQPHGTYGVSWRKIPEPWKDAFRAQLASDGLIEAPKSEVGRPSLEALRREARHAGDEAQVHLCDMALELGDPFARRACEDAINAAKAQQEAQ